MVLVGGILVCLGVSGAIYAFITLKEGAVFNGSVEFNDEVVEVDMYRYPLPFCVYSHCVLEDGRYVISVSGHLAFSKKTLIKKELDDIVDFLTKSEKIE
ncbi:MAG: hypothetical protein ACRCZZ_05440 [Phocaeicola sp.]